MLAILAPEIKCGYGELYSSGLPTGTFQMMAAQVSGATSIWLALAGPCDCNEEGSLRAGKGGAKAKAVSALQRYSVDDIAHSESQLCWSGSRAPEALVFVYDYYEACREWRGNRELRVK